VFNKDDDQRSRGGGSTMLRVFVFELKIGNVLGICGINQNMYIILLINQHHIFCKRYKILNCTEQSNTGQYSMHELNTAVKTKVSCPTQSENEMEQSQNYCYSEEWHHTVPNPVILTQLNSTQLNSTHPLASSPSNLNGTG
jgi:hypothetical protein